MLGLDYESKRGYIGLEYYGRSVGINILPVGIHIRQLESVLNLPDTALRIGEMKERFKGKKMLLSVDDMDIFKAITKKDPSGAKAAAKIVNGSVSRRMQRQILWRHEF